MDENWASPWEEEPAIHTEPPTGSFQAPVSQPPIHNHHSPWSIAEGGGEDWQSGAQSHWNYSRRENRVSESPKWDTSDGQSRPSQPVPPRQHSPDPWAGVPSLNDERVEIQLDAVNSKGGATLQESESANHGHIRVAGVEQGPKVERDNDDAILGASALEEKLEEIQPGVPGLARTQFKPKAAGDDIKSTDATSSRPSSSLSDHDDNSTESPRTSFEQEPAQDPSKVKKLVSHFDRLAKEIEGAPVVTRKESSNEDNSINTVKHDDNATREESDGDEFGDFEEEAAVSTHQVSQDGAKSNIASVPHNVAFNVDLSLVEKLLADMFPISKASEKSTPAVDQRTEDIFTTIEERKAWHRISRYGTMRKHDTGNDENYRRVKWESSKAREETIRIVSRWRTEDSISGSVVLGGSNQTSMFGWDDKDKRSPGPINMSAIWAERAERSSKHRTMASPTSLKTTLESLPGMVNQESMGNSISPPEPSAKFGWSTEDISTSDKFNTPPSPASSSSLSLEPPPPPSPSISTPLSQQSRTQSSVRPTSLDYSQYPRIASIKGLGHRSTMSLDRKPPRPASAPVMPVLKPALPVPEPEESPHLESTLDHRDDEDDWGDMISSTPDLDSVFPDSAPEEPLGSRNRADSAPGLQILEQIPATKRPKSLQPRVVHSVSIKALSSLELENVSNESVLPKADQQQPLSLVLVPKLPNMPTPPATSIPTIPKLSVITDDFDAWGITPAAPITETIAGMSTSISTRPTSGLKLSTITIDDFDAWASHDDHPPSASETSFQPISVTRANTSSSLLPQQLPPPSANVDDKMDGWADVDFSVFESTVPTRATVAKDSEQELPNYNAKSSEGSQKDFGASSSPERDTLRDKLEEDRIVKSIVGKLPDLRYMFLP